jgi:hypothetical protein
LQDNLSEKAAEIMQMDQIYLNYTLNISATEARSREGLVFDRDILSTSPCRATVRVLETKVDVHLQAFPNKWFLRRSEGPLNKRGWVFQERTLAPRIVHFTKNQVFWECHSHEASEILPQGVPGGSPTRLNKGVETSSASTIEQVNLQWYNLVGSYSHTSLSFADDRLLAISAVAKWCCLGMRLDFSEYLAGMWKNDLPLSMLWYQSESTISVGMEMKHAPSWSWASILAPVSFIRFSSPVATAEVLDVHIRRLSPNTFGGTDSCRLRLRGHICRFRRRVQDSTPWIYIGQHTGFQEFPDFAFQRGKSIILQWDTSRRVVSEFLNSDGSTSATSTYVLLHIASENSVDGLIERGIILLRTSAYGMYVRIGAFLTPFKSEYPCSELEEAFKGHLKTLSSGDYLELDSKGRYTIDVF